MHPINRWGMMNLPTHPLNREMVMHPINRRGDDEFAYSSAKPRSGDAFVAPSRPSRGETKMTEGKFLSADAREAWG